MIDDWKEAYAVLQDEHDKALSTLEAEILKTNRLKKELVSAQVCDFLQHPF